MGTSGGWDWDCWGGSASRITTTVLNSGGTGARVEISLFSHTVGATVFVATRAADRARPRPGAAEPEEPQRTGVWARLVVERSDHDLMEARPGI